MCIRDSAAGRLLRGQLAIGVYDDLGRVREASGVQIGPVLDDLYAAAATRRTYGVAWSGGVPTLRLWAPTARSVTLLTWPPGTPGDAPVRDATRTVSYTHLDVYKRQATTLAAASALGWPSASMALACAARSLLDASCLLYTSRCV